MLTTLIYENSASKRIEITYLQSILHTWDYLVRTTTKIYFINSLDLKKKKIWASNENRKWLIRERKLENHHQTLISNVIFNGRGKWRSIFKMLKEKKKTIKATFRNKDTNYTKHARIKKIIPWELLEELTREQASNKFNYIAINARTGSGH